MTNVIIWGGAAFLYLLFWSWYVGFDGKMTTAQVDEAMQELSAHGAAGPEASQLEVVRQFLLSDDGKDFVMVNGLHLKEPKEQSRELLEKYSKAFLGDLLKRAGHPVFFARAAAPNIESLNAQGANNWTAAGMIRYRSRADFAAMAVAYAGGEHHGFKLAALEKTFAFPGSPWFVFGDARLMAALVLALLAALLQIFLRS